MEQLEPRCFLSANGVINVTQGLPDLQVTIAPSFKVPTHALSGTGAVINLPVTITNIDETIAGGKTVVVPANQTATIRVVARPEAGPDDGSADIEVGKMEDVVFDGLKVGAKKSLKVPVTLTDDIGGGSWKLVVLLDENQDIVELGEDPAATAGSPLQANNIAQTAAFPVTLGRPDLQVTIVSQKSLPTTVTSANGKFYNVTLRVTNHGTVAAAADAVTTVMVTLDSILNTDPTRENSSQDIGTPLAVNIGGLKPNASVQVVATVYFPDAVNDSPNQVDQEHFTFTVNPDNSIKELPGNNNSTSSKTVAVTLGAALLDFDVAANKQLPKKPLVAGAGQLFNVTAKITNLGNAPWSKESSTSYKVDLKGYTPGYNPNSNPDLTDPTKVTDDDGEEVELDMPTLAPGKSYNYTTSHTVKINATPGTYTLWERVRFKNVAGIDVVHYFQVAEQPISTTAGFVNLTPSIPASATLPKNTLSGNGATFQLPVDIKNNGLIPTQKDATISVKLSLLRADDLSADPVKVFDNVDVAIGAIAPGKTLRVTVPYSFDAGDGLDAGDNDQYVIVAELDGLDVSVTEVGDSLLDNTSASSKPFHMTKGDPDLTAILPANLKLPANLISGDGKSFNLPVTIKNIGNLAVDDGSITSISIFAVDPDGTRKQVGEFDEADISKLGHNGSKKFNVPVTLDTSVLTNTYTFSVVVNPDGGIGELPADNNTATTTATIAVTQGAIDLAATINGAALEGTSVRAGDGSTILLPLTIKNLGNLSTVAGQKIDVHIYAMNANDQSDVTKYDVTTIAGMKIGGLKPQAERLYNLKVALPPSLKDGSYQLFAEVDSGRIVPETGDTSDANAANNTATGPTLNITQHGSDLTASFPADLSLPANLVSGDGTKFTLPLIINNVGDVPVPNGGKVTIVITAHNQADGDDITNDVVVQTLENISVAGLTLGTPKTVNATVTLPVGLGPGDFVLTANVDSDNLLPELSDLNNLGHTGPMSADAS